MKKNLLKKVLIIAIPTYSVAILTKTITTIIATNIFQEDKDTENRVEEDSDSDTDDTDGGDDTYVRI